MRILKNIVPSLLAFVVITASVSTISAQSEGSLQFEDLEGIQKAYARTFNADMAAMANGATPGATANGWYALLAMALQFDSADHAGAGLETVLNEVEASSFAGEGGQVEDVELDIDMEHVARRNVLEADGMTVTALIAAVHDDEHVYLVAGVTFGEDPAPVVASTLSSIVETDASSEAETLRENGTSEGGLWARFPSLEEVQADAPALVEVEDQELYPVPSQATPVVASEPTIETIGTPAG